MKHFSKEVAFLVAMFTNSLAISLLVKSVFGVSTLSSLPLVLSDIFDSISFGMMNFMVQTVLLMILMAITRQIKAAYIFSFVIGFIFGLMVDGFDLLMVYLPDLFLLRIIYFFTGWALISFGAALFIKSMMPLMPFDAFVKDMALYFRVKVKLVKTISDLIFVSSAVILSLTFLGALVGVGIGTIFMAFFTGSLTQYFLDLLSKKYDFICLSTIGEKLNAIAKIKTKQA